MALKVAKAIWLNGRLVPWKRAQLHLLNFTLHYGAGAFEGIRFYDTARGPKVFRLQDHLRRLFYSAETLGLRIPYSQKALTVATKALIRKNGMRDGYLRPFVYFGYGAMGISAKGLPTEVMLAAWSWERAKETHPAKVKISSFRRIHPASTRVDAKLSGHYANSALAFNEARDAGYDDALMLDAQGFASECAVANIFMAKKGVVYTPPRGTILPGITRATVIELLRRELGVRVAEKKLKPQDLKRADEMFSTGTAHEVTPIVQIDKAKIGTGKPGPLTLAVAELYSHIVHGEVPRYRHWCE